MKGEIEMRIRNQISMGNSMPKSTEGQILELHKILDEALIELSGEQQNGGMGYFYDEKAGIKARENIERAICDIAMALTGLRITFEKENLKRRNKDV